MLTRTCDNCGAKMPDDAGRWEVDYVDALAPLKEFTSETGDVDRFIEIPQIEINPQPEFHFCGADCLSSWAMGRALEDQEST